MLPIRGSGAVGAGTPGSGGGEGAMGTAGGSEGGAVDMAEEAVVWQTVLRSSQR